MSAVPVILLRQDLADLPPGAADALEALFTGKRLEYARTDAVEYEGHDQDCLRLGSMHVVLPRDRPIPDKAMKRGVNHLAFVNGKWMKLVGFEPQFEPFEPGKS